jgi:hypothetical protein
LKADHEVLPGYFGQPRQRNFSRGIAQRGIAGWAFRVAGTGG